MTAAGRYVSNVLKTKYQTFETYARATQKPKLSYRDGLQGVVEHRGQTPRTPQAQRAAAGRWTGPPLPVLEQTVS